MAQKVIERRPAFGMVFLVKYSFDNKTWNQFWSELAQENGNLLSFYGCKVKMVYSDTANGALKIYASPIQDVQLDGNRARTVGLIVKKPEWFEISEADAEGSCKESAGPFHLPGVNIYAN